MDKIKLINHTSILNRINATTFKFTTFSTNTKYYINRMSDCDFYISYISYILSAPLRASIFDKSMDSIFTVSKFNVELSPNE